MKNYVALGLLIFSLPMLAACDRSEEQYRSVVEVVSVAENGIFISGQLDAGGDKEVGTTDDFRPAGHVIVRMKNRAYNSFVSSPDGGPYGQFHVTSVQVEWNSADQAIEDQLNAHSYTANYDVTIPRDSETEFLVMLVPLSMKSAALLTGLETGATPEFFASADITFMGHDSGDERSREVTGSCIVEFIGIVFGS